MRCLPSITAATAELVTVKRQLDALNASESDKQRRIEALTAEIDTIDAAALHPGEERPCRSARMSSPTPRAFWKASPPHICRWRATREQSGAADLLGGAVDGLQRPAG